jgi:hypothetical protein
VKPLVQWVFAVLLASLLLPAVLAFTTAPGTPAAHHRQLPASPVYHAETVTISVPGSYTVQPGDTLSALARRFYGHARLWPALWWTNHRSVRNPNDLLVGVRLTLARWHPDRAWIYGKALRHIPVPKPPPAAPAAATTPDQGAADPAPAAPSSQPASTVSEGSSGSFQQCVIAAESGGNPQAVNPSSGAGGLYQFLPSTWAALGHSGLPENAPVAEQNQAFAQEVAQSGTSAWSAYDGC